MAIAAPWIAGWTKFALLETEVKLAHVSIFVSHLMTVSLRTESERVRFINRIMPTCRFSPGPSPVFHHWVSVHLSFFGVAVMSRM